MNNKHKAVWAVGGLVLVFLVLAAWYFYTHPAPRALAPGETATTTTPISLPETLHIIENTKYYEIDTSYPSATPLRASAGAEADAAAVASMKTFEQNLIDAFKENADLTHMTPERFAEETFSDDRKYAMIVKYTLYGGAKTVSYDYLIYQDTLGAHPNSYHRTFTFDRETGEAIELDELFALGTPYLERLSARTRADLPAIMAKMSQQTPADIDREAINDGTPPDADAFGNFVIDGSTLLMIFPPYQVGPYVYGTVTDPIPFSALRDILNPKYRP